MCSFFCVFCIFKLFWIRISVSTKILHILFELRLNFRFFRYMLLLFMVHQMALSLFRLMASLGRDMIIANTGGSGVLMILFLLGGFIVPKGRLRQKTMWQKEGIYICYAVGWWFWLHFSGMIKPWWLWGYWLSPLNYGQRAVSVNEFTATRWMGVLHACLLNFTFLYFNFYI